MPPRYLLSPEAQQDIQDIRAYYLKEADARIARYVLSQVARNFRLLAVTPAIGHARPDLTDEPVKFWPVFSFLIVYDPTTRPISVARKMRATTTHQR